MEEELGKEKTTELAQYLRAKTLSPKIAATILRSIWPEAPDLEVAKAALLCASYGLNPLMKHVFLVKFGNNWSTILALRATRLIASRKHRYSYLDGPRVMTEEEQGKTFGAADNAKIWVITILQDENGNKAPGYGGIDLKATIYGTDKGNTAFNMASARSERQAFERLFPSDMPTGVEVEDERFLEGVFEALPPTSPTKQPPKAPPSPKEEDFPKPEAIKNLGDLRTAWHKFFPKEPWEEALAIIGVESQTQIADAGESWRRILEAPVPKQGERKAVKTSE